MGGNILGAVAALAVATSTGRALAAGGAGCNLGRPAEGPVTMQERMPIVSATIDGAPVRMMADTGAFSSILTPTAATRLGLSKRLLPDGLSVRGDNGSETAHLAAAESIEVFGLTLKRPQFIVTARAMDGVIDGVLGQNLLMLGDLELDLPDGAIRIHKPQGCGKAWLAYWDPLQRSATADLVRVTGMPARAVIVRVRVNGVPLKAEIDSGASDSVISASAARRVGAQLFGPRNVWDGDVRGVGGRVMDVWMGPFDSFEFGNERIDNLRIGITEMNIRGIDMILGADFLLSHRVMISLSQNRVYATYLEGPVFRGSPSAPGFPAPVGAVPGGH